MNNEEKKSVSITPWTGSLKLETFAPTPWTSAHFAPLWFSDAQREATTGNDENAVRREIIFSACFLESYIFEWVRNIDIGIVNNYFPAKSKHRMTLKEKWKEVPKELFHDRKIYSEPELDLGDLGRLIEYRNGLIHARASRPSTATQPPEEKPVPGLGELKKQKPGWALSIAADLVMKLHQDLGTDPPDYVKSWANRKP